MICKHQLLDLSSFIEREVGRANHSDILGQEGEGRWQHWLASLIVFNPSCILPLQSICPWYYCSKDKWWFWLACTCKAFNLTAGERSPKLHLSSCSSVTLFRFASCYLHLKRLYEREKRNFGICVFAIWLALSRLCFRCIEVAQSPAYLLHHLRTACCSLGTIIVLWIVSCIGNNQKAIEAVIRSLLVWFR